MLDLDPPLSPPAKPKLSPAERLGVQVPGAA